MKKQFLKIAFAAVSSLVVVSGAMAASGQGTIASNADMCVFIKEFQGIFKMLRTLAFLGAGFTIAGWAWGWISKPDEIKVEDLVKKKGLPMLIGFILLFGIGTVLQLLSTAGGLKTLGIDCPAIFTGW